eukprot:SAG31_NODE_13928_length_837_cov_1.021680_1_plen_35_part_10
MWGLLPFFKKKLRGRAVAATIQVLNLVPAGYRRRR